MKIVIAIIKLLSFTTAFVGYLITVPYQGLMPIDYFLTKVFLLIFFIIGLFEAFSNIYEADQSKIQDVISGLFIGEVMLALVALFYFCLIKKFDLIEFLWVGPLILRWYLTIKKSSLKREKKGA